jgi:predicted DsbA family dithiol-disulfide isomerase
MLARLKQVAGELDLPFGERRMTFNSRLAQELGKWAEDQGRGDAFHHGVFLAYFRDGDNIARHEVLLKVCSDAGLEPAQARDVLDRRTYRQAVDRDWERSHRLGITAVPTFVGGGQRLVGAQPYQALVKLAMDAGAPQRTGTNGLTVKPGDDP